jgi:hypothetical protein
MNNQIEREPGTARVLFDRFKVNNDDVSRAVVKGLTAAGDDGEIVPGFTLGGVYGEPVPQGDIITVYRKER